MAFPTILIDSATGSNSGTSGAGPATPITGTAASFSGDTITLDGSPDLSGVANDGSHVIRLITSTGVQYFQILARDNGAKTVQVTPNPAGTSSGLTWAIGGRRASLNDTSTRRLLDDGSSGDAAPGWTVQFASGHTETTTANIRIRRAGDGTNGPITVQGEPGATTRPVLTANFNGVMFITGAGTNHRFRHFSALNSNGTKTSSIFLQTGSGGNDWQVEDMWIGDLSGNGFGKATSTSVSGRVANSLIRGCASDGVELTSGSGTVSVVNTRIVSSGGAGISRETTSFHVSVLDSLLIGSAGAGFQTSGSGGGSESPVICGNIFHGNGGSGILLDSTAGRHIGMLQIFKNIFSANGAYGIDASAVSQALADAVGLILSRNAYWSNTSGLVAGLSDPQAITLSADPFVNAAAGDFNINDVAGGGALLRAANYDLPG